MPSTTYTYSAAVGQRIAVALGKAWQLKDANGDPRNATKAECDSFGMKAYQQLLIDVEGAELTKQAIAAVVVPPADFT